MDSRDELRCGGENRHIEITAGKKPARGCSEARRNRCKSVSLKPGKQPFTKEEKWQLKLR